MKKQNLTKAEKAKIMETWLSTKNVEVLLENRVRNNFKNDNYGEYNYQLLKSGEQTLDSLIDVIFGRYDNHKISKYTYYNINNIRNYCQGWYFDCIHDAPQNYYFNDVVRLIKDMIIGVLEYDEKGAFAKYHRRGE